MTALAPRVLPAALLERDRLVAADLLDDLAGDERAGHHRAAHQDVVAAHHQHLGELDDVAELALDLLDGDPLIGGDPVLLAARLDDCEHRSCPRVRPRRAEFLRIPDRLFPVASYAFLAGFSLAPAPRARRNDNGAETPRRPAAL